MSEPVGIVGGGLGGLAAACTLAARGYPVVLFEQNQWLGGKAAVLEAEGYRFDMGPTIVTLPSVLHRIWGEAKADLADDLDLVRLNPQWRCFYDDGTVLDLVEEVAAMAASLDRWQPGTGAGYERFMALSADLDRISRDYFFYRPIGSVRDMFDLRQTAKPGLLADLLKLRAGRSVAETVRAAVPEPRVAQMLDHFVQYVGSSPEKSPAVLCGIGQMQVGEGVWYPIGGTGAVPRALVALAGRLGVRFRTGVEVQRIERRGGRAGWVVLRGGERVAVSAVVSNSDTVRGHEELLGGEAQRRFSRRRRYEPACSGVVLYLGLDRGYEHLAHHNFVFSRDPHEEFAAIYEAGEPAPDPTCYLAAPARTEPGVAPAGGEALYVLVHTPYLRDHHRWGKLLPGYRQVILDKLKTAGGMPDLESRIKFEAHLTPEDIDRRYRVWRGAIYGLASHGLWDGAFKPSNRSPDVPGLYFAGGSAHPGPGMPMALMSGWIAADVLDTDGLAG